MLMSEFVRKISKLYKKKIKNSVMNFHCFPHFPLQFNDKHTFSLQPYKITT